MGNDSFKPAAPKTYTGQTIMPPPLSKTSLNSLSRCRGPSNSIPLRSFSTSSSLASIGPENPKFIEIPVPPQHQALPKIDVKGTLPPPRNIFPNRAGELCNRDLYRIQIARLEWRKRRQGWRQLHWLRRSNEGMH